MDKKTKVKLILTGVTLAATLLEGYVSSKVKTDKDKQINKLISEVRDEMSAQAEDENTYSMQDYHNDMMKYIEDKLSGMSRETVLAVRDNVTGWHQTTKELREFVDHIDVIDNNLKAKEEK